MYQYQSLQLWDFKLRAWRDARAPKGECQLCVLFPALPGVAQSVLHPLFLACNCLISVLQPLAHLETERGKVGERFGFIFSPIPVPYLLPRDVLVERAAVPQPVILHLRLCWGLRFRGSRCCFAFLSYCFLPLQWGQTSPYPQFAKPRWALPRPLGTAYTLALWHFSW